MLAGAMKNVKIDYVPRWAMHLEETRWLNAIKNKAAKVSTCVRTTHDDDISKTAISMNVVVANVKDPLTSIVFDLFLFWTQNGTLAAAPQVLLLLSTVSAYLHCVTLQCCMTASH